MNKLILLGLCLLIETKICAQTNIEDFVTIGISNFQAGKFAISLTNFTKATELNTNFLPAYFWQGLAKFEIKDYSGAIVDFDRVIKAKLAVKDDYILGDAFNQRGRSKFALKDLKGAFDDFNQAIRLKPTMAETYYNRGLVEARLKRFTEAIADYTKAIELNTDPRNEDIFFWRGNAEMEIKNFNGAISDYTKVTKSNPNFGFAYTNLIAAKEALHAVKK